MDAYRYSGHMPLFEEVKQKMLEQIKNGIWTPDSMLPNELEVAAMFGVSQGTVRRAFRELVAQGILVRYQGRGTFVASQRRNVAAVREGSVSIFVSRVVFKGAANHGCPSCIRG